jgi:hypothetical protein
MPELIENDYERHQPFQLKLRCLRNCVTGPKRDQEHHDYDQPRDFDERLRLRCRWHPFPQSRRWLWLPYLLCLSRGAFRTFKGRLDDAFQGPVERLAHGIRDELLLLAHPRERTFGQSAKRTLLCQCGTGQSISKSLLLLGDLPQGCTGELFDAPLLSRKVCDWSD